MENKTEIKNDFSNSNSNKQPEHHSDTNSIPIKLVNGNKVGIDEGAIAADDNIEDAESEEPICVIAPHIHPAIKQLLALGYEVGDIVTGRNISLIGKKNIDWRGELTEDNITIQVGTWRTGNFQYDGEIFDDGLGWLDEQNDHRGIYFNVNGGRDNTSVKRYYAAFFESDRGSHEEQQNFINGFKLKPTCQVRTKRSNHTYYRVSFYNYFECQELDKYVKLQEKQAYVFCSDPAMKDKPRLMRLAGFYHVSWADFIYDGGEFDYIECELIQLNENNLYTHKELHNALDEYCIQQGIKPYSDARFKLYQYIISKLNQKKNGIDYSHPKFDPNLARICEDSELEEISTRAHNFARLCERRHKGIDCPDPATAWSDSLEKIKKAYQSDFDINTVYKSDAQLREAGLLNETLPHYFARKYAIGFTDVGEQGARSHWATCQCPHHGSSSGSEDNLHINVDDPNYTPGAISCKSGCDPKDVMLSLRQLAQDAGDPLWNISSNKQECSQKKEFNKEEWIEERNKKHRENWHKSKQLNPTIKTNTEYFFYGMRSHQQLSLFGDIPEKHLVVSIPEENIILAGCADLGGGKSTWMKMMIKTIRETCPNERWFALGYINGLLLQQRGSWKQNEVGARRFKHLQSEKAFRDIHQEKQDLALCIHSLKHFADYLYVFDGCNIVIDEIVSVVKALLQDDNIKDSDRGIILHVFTEAIKRAKRIFCFDANLSDMTTWYLSKVCPEKKLISVKNEYKRPKPKIEFLLGSQELEKQLSSVDKIKKTDNSPICKALLNSNRFVLVSDNRTVIQILAELMRSQGKNVLVVCRDTNGQPDVKEFLECPDRWIKTNWIEKGIDGCVLISPTGGSGLDISVKNYFTDLYGLFFGVIDVDSILQMLGRLRDENARFHVWVKEKGSIQNVLGNFSKEIQRNVREYIKQLQTMIWEGWEGDPALEVVNKFSTQLLAKADDIHFKMQCALMSQQLFEEWHLRDCVQETLINRGYELNSVVLEEDASAKTLIKEQREKLNSQWSKDIFNAIDLTEEKANEISSSFFQTPEQKNALKKYYLRSRLPGIETTELWKEDFIAQVLFKDPFYLSQLETLFLLRNPEIAKKKAQTRWAEALAKESLRHFDLINERYARIRALQNIKIEFFLDPENSWTKETPELIEAAKEAKKPHNKAALPKAPGRDLVKWMQNILSTLSYDTSGHRIDSEKRKYKITLKEEEEKQKEIVLDCLKRNEKFQDLDQKQKNHILRSKIAQNTCPERLKGDSRSSQFCLDKTSGIWSLENQQNPSDNSLPPYGEEQRNCSRHEEGDTEVRSHEAVWAKVYPVEVSTTEDWSDLNTLKHIKYVVGEETEEAG